MFARTERLLLRPGWMQDAPALFRAIDDEGIVRNLASAPWPYTLADAEAFLATERDPHDATALIFRRTGAAPELVGTIGIGRRPDGERELGYFIARRFWSRGYATEAGRAVLDFARDSLRIRSLNAGHFLDNPASGRVLEKLGFKPTGADIPRYSAGRREAAPCRLFTLDLAEPEARMPARDCMEMLAVA
jgi:RimJ/RimL family protein N-acetyltransferase